MLHCKNCKIKYIVTYYPQDGSKVTPESVNENPHYCPECGNPTEKVNEGETLYE